MLSFVFVVVVVVAVVGVVVVIVVVILPRKNIYRERKSKTFLKDCSVFIEVGFFGVGWFGRLIVV